MRKLVLILIAFIAVVTFIRAFDNSGGGNGGIFPAGINSPDFRSEDFGPRDFSPSEAVLILAE